MKKKFVRALFPGSFDPITNGHIDVIKRGISMFDEVIVGVGVSSVKDAFFMPDERVSMIREIFEGHDNVLVESYDCLTVEYAARIGANVMLRGLRNLTDVQYEFQLAMTNRAVAGIETVFIMTSEEFGFVSSTMIREVARLGGDVSNLIPKSVFDLLQIKLNKL